jgi:serine/threonine-protein kinase
MLALEPRADAVARGAEQPGAAERIEFGQLFKYRRRYAAASRQYAAAFALEPALLDKLTPGHRYDAACYAALAGCGQGADPPGIAERVRWRRQALTWLRAELAALARRVRTEEAPGRGAVERALRHWQRDADLAGVRGPAVERLPAEERGPWRKLWDDVAALARAVGEAPAGGHSTSQTTTVPVTEPAAACVPSGLNATPRRGPSPQSNDSAIAQVLVS